MICVPEAVTTTMNYTTAREAHELWVKSLKSLCKILAKTMTVVSILWHERNHIYIEITLVEKENLEVCLLAISVCSKLSTIFLPASTICVNLCLSENLVVLACKNHSYLLGIAFNATEENREVVLSTRLDVHSEVTFVQHTNTCPAIKVIVMTDALSIDSHVGWVVWVDGIIHARLDETGRMSRADKLPVSTRSPSVTLCRTVFETAILN